MSADEKYRNVAEIINTAGGTPLPVTDTLISIIKLLVPDDEVELLLAFDDAKSQTLEQLKQSSGLDEDAIIEGTEKLAKKGFIFNQPSSKGVMVYRMLPLFNVGVFEYRFMQKLEHTDENKKIALLFTQLFKEAEEFVQGSYEVVVGMMEQMPAVDRTVPIRVNKRSGKSTVIEINQDLDIPAETAMPTQEVVKLVEKFDEIAVGHCFCRHYKDLGGHSCKQTELRENCFTFGKSARYTSEQNFSRMIDKKEALEILSKCERDGLVHKAYHPNFNIKKDETSVCNCCKCCCGNSVDNQIGPIVNATNFLAQVLSNTCTGCEVCAEHCHTDAINLGSNDISHVAEDRCLGCGVCAYFCPEGAIELIPSQRTVRIAPPRK